MNNRNYICAPCRTVSRTFGARCRVCGSEMRRVNRVPKRGDDAGWKAIAAELRNLDEMNTASEWRAFVARCASR